MSPFRSRIQADKRLIFGLLLLLIVAAVYLPTLTTGFVYDSEAQVLNDSFIHNRANWADLLTLRVLSRDVLDFNRPMNLASLMVDSIVWGKNPFGYHLTNLLIHLCNCLLLFLLIYRWATPPPPSTPTPTLSSKSNRSKGRAGKSPTNSHDSNGLVSSLLSNGPELVALGGALLFGLHPVNTEAVAEVGFREDLLVVLFSLGGLLIVDRSKGALPGLMAAMACFFFAATSKETGMITPLWLGAWLVIFRSPIIAIFSPSASLPDRYGDGHRPPLQRNWIVLLAGTTLLVGLFTAARFLLEPTHSMIFTQKPTQLGGSFAETLLIQPRIWAVYFRQIVFPMDLCADYGLYSIRNFSFGTGLLLLLAVGAAQIYGLRRSKLFAFGAVTFWFFLLPVSNFIPMFRPMADRFLYFPMAGVALMAAALLKALPNRGRAAAVIIALVSIPLAARTLSQEQIWRDNLSLWKVTLETNPTSMTALNNLTGILVQRGKPAEALEVFAKAGPIMHQPTAETFAVQAVAFDALGRREEADTAFKQAARMDPQYGDPDRLVQALTWNRRDADKLKVIANRIYQ